MEKIIIIDDHRLFRETLAGLINADNNFEVIGQSSSAQEAMNMVSLLNPAMLIMDMNLPGMNGVEATTCIHERYPTVKIIGLSMHISPDICRQFFRAGASAYLTKNTSGTELITALKEVQQHRKYTCTEIKDIIAIQQLGADPQKAKAELTKREKEIISYLRQGLSSREIALKIKMALKTVETHRYNMLKKLGLPNTASLLTYIHRNDMEYR